jgi:hypothetical protein
MKCLIFPAICIGATLLALSFASAQEPKPKDPPPAEPRVERAPPREPRREGGPNRPPPRDNGDPDGPRDRPPPRYADPQPRGGFGPGGPGGPGPGGGFRPGDGRGRGPGGFGLGFGGPPGMGPGGEGFFPEDPEMAALNRAEYDLDQQTRDLADKLRGMKKGDGEKIKAEITEVVTKHFDVRQQRRELQIKRMEDELKKLRESMTRRNDSKEQIIKKRLAELVGNEDDLGF